MIKYKNMDFEKIDPFDATPEMISENEEKIRLYLLKRVSEIYKKLIQEKFEETRASSMILCDRRVIFSSSERYAPWKQDIKKIEKILGKVCYIFTKEESPIEERARYKEEGLSGFL